MTLQCLQNSKQTKTPRENRKNPFKFRLLRNKNKSIKGCGELPGEISPFASETFPHFCFGLFFHPLLPFTSFLPGSIPFPTTPLSITPPSCDYPSYNFPFYPSYYPLSSNPFPLFFTSFFLIPLS